MALVKTTLTAGIKASDLLWTVANTTVGFPPVGTVLSGSGQPIMVDEEVAFLVQVPVAGQLLVRSRGSDGTLADAHDIGAAVITSSLPSDFPAVAPGAFVTRPPAVPDVDFYGQDGAISIPIQDTKAAIGKATAAALTLGAPSLAGNGMEFVITSQTAAAHVITTVSLLATGAAGSPFNTVTFPAQIGATIYLVAQNGLWNVVSTQVTMVFA